VNQSTSAKKQDLSSAGQIDLLFISWGEDCSRSDSIAQRLGGRSVMLYSPFWGSRYSTIAFKYLSQIIKTLRVLLRHKPRTVIVMTPPVIACIPVWIYAKLTRGQYAIDAHTGAFLDTRWTSTLFLHKFFSRHAVATLVASPFLADLVNSWSARVLLVSDVPVCFAEPNAAKLKGDVNMVFISTFTRDEPLQEFLVAAGHVPDVHFYVTGRLKYANPEVLKQAPANVTFTDFLSSADYVGLLLACDAVICLTIEDHTMQRGAYEAVYLGKPVITSDYEILRQAFSAGTVHVGADPNDIARGILAMKKELRRHQQDVAQLRADKLKRWRNVSDELNRLFGREPAQTADGNSTVAGALSMKEPLPSRLPNRS